MSAATVTLGAPRPRTWTFQATPPRGSEKVLVGRQDTRTVDVVIRTASERAEILVNGRVAAATSRRDLRDWLRRSGVRPNYEAGDLVLRYTNLGIWLEIVGRTAFTPLLPHAQGQIIELLAP